MVKRLTDCFDLVHPDRGRRRGFVQAQSVALLSSAERVVLPALAPAGPGVRDVPAAFHRALSAAEAVPLASVARELPGVVPARAAGPLAADELELPRDAPVAEGGHYRDLLAAKAVPLVFSQPVS
jgi:hypothetical protein